MKKAHVIVALIGIFCVPLLVAAQIEYQPLAGIPGVTTGTQPSFAAYVNALYSLAITGAAMFAVIKIVLAGVKYMTSSLVSGKEDAKGDILGALLGLLIILGTFLILNTINPNLTIIRIEPPEQIRYNPTEQRSADSRGTDCDKSLAGDLCGCNEVLVLTSGPGGGSHRCDILNIAEREENALDKQAEEDLDGQDITDTLELTGDESAGEAVEKIEAFRLACEENPDGSFTDREVVEINVPGTTLLRRVCVKVED